MSYLNTDVPELKGYDTGTVLGNLELLEERIERILEVTMAELSELSLAILQDASGDPEMVSSILLSLRGQPTEEAPLPLKSHRLLPAHRKNLINTLRHLGLYERLVLYSLIQARASEYMLPQVASPTEPAVSAQGRIAYMSNPFADKAYIRFAEHIPHCRAATVHSFLDACEEVWSGLCEYCILPLENSADGKLIGFSRLIVKYHLQIIAVCDIEGATGAPETATRFALLRSSGGHWDAPIPLPLPKANAPYLEVLHTTANPSYAEMTAAAEFCGLTLARVDTLPASELYPLLFEDEYQPRPLQTSYPPLVSTVWHTQGSDLPAFLLYLYHEASEDPILGLYPLL